LLLQEVPVLHHFYGGAAACNGLMDLRVGVHDLAQCDGQVIFVGPTETALDGGTDADRGHLTHDMRVSQVIRVMSVIRVVRVPGEY
jgi:hypothetical protein